MRNLEKKNDVNHDKEKGSNEAMNKEINSNKSKEADQSIDEKNDEVDKVKEELACYKDKFLRVAAEYDNYRKRTEKEKAAIYSDATIVTLQSILPVIDSLELASKSLDGVGEEYRKGIEMVSNQLSAALNKLGVECFGEVGEEFDPNIHNAVSHIDDENEKNNVISSVFQKGYKICDRVIRHAMVQVTN